jgi:hypothetical protein
VHGVRIKHKTLDRLLLDEPGVIGAGGNSGFQALNIALQFGATRILLIGFDMSGEHYYGRNNWPQANNPSDSTFIRWRAAFAAAASDLRTMGVEVINTSMQTALNCFVRRSIDEVLETWSL